MPAESIFVVDPRKLGDLDAAHGTRLVADLLRCEATKIGIPTANVVISTKVTAKDSGIDAKVEGAPAGSALLQMGSTYLQIKTGTTFKPWLKKHLLKELFGSSHALPAAALLGQEVKNCLTRKGKYVLLTLGHDLLPSQHSAGVDLLREVLGQCGHINPRVDLIGQGQIASILREYPSLYLDLKGLGEAPFQSLAGWSKNADMQGALVLAEDQVKFIDQVRDAWRGNRVQHIRVVGEPGIGKTRLVLEAASATDIGASILYIPHAEDFQKSALFNELLKPDRNYTASLVIDECEENERASIWNALKGKLNLKLVTIDHGPESSSDASMEVLQCPVLPAKQIGQILTSYVGRRTDVSNWAEWCEGSPRVAHAVGENLKRNPQDILKSPATVPIWNRFVLGHRRVESKVSAEHFLVLRYLALFQRFGFEEPVSSEAKFVSELVAEADPAITWAKFQEIVRHHHGRRVLQGRHTLFIVPKALHVHLWVDFWNKHGLGFDFQGFMDRLPNGLRHWFLRLFIYAHASPVAQRVVKGILAYPSGPFGRSEFLTSATGTRFLNYLAEADPGSTLELLERTFGNWPLEELHRWHSGRQDIVWALEKIAVWRDNFARAANLLGRMALAENATNGNNSKGTFIELFRIGVGWAATQAEPNLRLPVVARLLQSSAPNERALALEAAGEWLSTHGGTRIVGAEYQGMRPMLEFWSPRTYGEMFDAWRSMWSLLQQEVFSWGSEARPAGLRRIVDSGLELVRYVALNEEVLATLSRVAGDPYVDKRHFVQGIIRSVRHPSARYPKGVRARLMNLDKRLTGFDYWGQFCRFVLYTNWDEDYRVVQDRVIEERGPSTRVVRLAKRFVRDKAIRESHLKQILTSDGHRLAQFGFEIAEQQRKVVLDVSIFDAVRELAPKVSGEFVGGYLSAIRRKDEDRWRRLVIELLESPSMRDIGVAVVWRSGVSDELVEKLVTLYQARAIGASVFARIGYGDESTKIGYDALALVFEALMTRADVEALNVCADLASNYFCRVRKQDPLPTEFAYRIICSTIPTRDDQEGMRGHRWSKLARKFRSQHPERDPVLLETLLEELDGMSRIRSNDGPSAVADEIVKSNPQAAWQKISEVLAHGGRRASELVAWLGEAGFEDRVRGGAMGQLVPDDVISWLKELPQERVELVFRAIPRTLDPMKGGDITRLFIDTFGDQHGIGDRLVSHFTYGGGWTGPRSAYLSRKRDRARYWLSEIKSVAIQNWLTRYIASLSNEIEAAQIEEERERF